MTSSGAKRKYADRQCVVVDADVDVFCLSCCCFWLHLLRVCLRLLIMLVLLKCSICAPLVELYMFRVLSFVGDRFNLSVHCYSANLLDIFYPSLVCHPIVISH